MNGIELADYSGKCLALAANLFVAVVCLTAYRRTKIPPLLILSLAAILAMLALLFDLFLLRSAATQTTFTATYISILILWLADVLLYSIGVFLLVTNYLKVEGPATEPGES